MVVYIAGKISGDPEYRRKFAKWEKTLTERGQTVLNPAVLPDGLGPDGYMRVCFAMIDTADAVFMLPDFRDSVGAMLERDYATYCGKEILYPADLE